MKVDTGGQSDFIMEGQAQVTMDITAQSVANDIASNSPMVASTSIIGERSSRGQDQELGGNMGVVNPILTLENFSSSGFSFPQPVVASTSATRGLAPELIGNVGVVNPIPTSENNSNSRWQHPSGGNNTIDGLGTHDPLPLDPPQVGASLGNSMFPNSMENSLNQFQSTMLPSFPMLPYSGGASSSSDSHQQFQRHHPFEITELGPLGTPTMRYYAQQKDHRNILHPPPLMDVQGYVKTWEGCLVGRDDYSYRASFNQAGVMIKPTSPSSLTSAWSSRLEIVIFIPKNAVNYTLKIIGGPIDYVFFHTTEFNNLDLYHHLMSKNLCAKIELPTQTIILSTTESKYHFLGIIFPADTIFIELA
ncbi:mediator of RNA polymerase II transcription subunit 25 isoform X2 [Cajanus cajan]|uniref:mediator of RNA polymerase II transcription subunit 25 isoform X2 n=1 Tax=Cajanus cajan TaxID=3821 RepID=UPI00098DACA3|nr:mediator of RNA polymerase II transcription subunit 25 isoform X2 [Cajanus cajan]